MAKAGCPVSEPVPPGTVSLELTLSAQSLLDTTKISTQDKLEPMGTAGEICKEHVSSSVTTERCPSSLSGSIEQGGSYSEHCVARPHSLIEAQTPLHHYNTAQSVKSAALPVHRSHSDVSPLTKQAVPPHTNDNMTRGQAWHAADRSTQEAESHSMLACKQPMQLQQCNIVTTVCRGAASGEVGPQQPQSKCICRLFPRAVDDRLNPKCDKVLCYGSFIHHANFEDTFAAYCHPQPIPAPSQLLPRLTGVELSCDMQRAPPLATDHLTPPRLISSVSETGLDGKHLLRCCNISCSLMSSLPPGPATQKHYIEEECCSCATGRAKTMTHDMSTMTILEQRDVGVQTGESDSVTPHVFPQICLAESRSETSSTQTPNTDRDAGKKPCGVPKTPVKEVKWDAEGMTWEVYGASVDPEELGLAIQRHLELQIKETASRAAKLSRQNTNTSRQSGNTGCQKKRSRKISYIRTPACCAGTTTAVD